MKEMSHLWNMCLNCVMKEMSHLWNMKMSQLCNEGNVSPMEYENVSTV